MKTLIKRNKDRFCNTIASVALVHISVLCSIRIHRIVPRQETLTRADVWRVHQSTVSADKDLSAKDINLGQGSYSGMAWGRRVRLKEHPKQGFDQSLYTGYVRRIRKNTSL